MATKLTEVKIELWDDGQIKVFAPFDNELLCYGLLEKGKDIVKAQAGKPVSNIIKPNLIIKNG
jgi:hypothetical protein